MFLPFAALVIISSHMYSPSDLPREVDPMYPSVLSAYKDFSSTFEGYVPWMYTDVKNLVTTGMGNLIDSAGAAQALPWRHGVNGPLASSAEIATAWSGVKNAGLAGIGGGNARFQALNDLRLDDAGIQKLIAGKLSSNEAILRKRFPGYDSLPADAQLGILSMAWAMGANFNFPKFQAAINKTYPDFETAAVESHMNDVGNPGLVPRNAANYQLFMNAKSALDQGLALDHLQWGGVGQVIENAPVILAQEASQQVEEVTADVAKNKLRTVAIAGIGAGVIGLALSAGGAFGEDYNVLNAGKKRKS